MHDVLRVFISSFYLISAPLYSILIMLQICFLCADKNFLLTYLSLCVQIAQTFGDGLQKIVSLISKIVRMSFVLYFN